MSTVPVRPIDRIRAILDEHQLELTYAYDDLIFVEPNAFLLQMGERGEDVTLFFNTESDEAERPGLLARLAASAGARELKLQNGGLFTMTQKENEELEIRFLP